jgi:hypothetical protein
MEKEVGMVIQRAVVGALLVTAGAAQGGIISFSFNAPVGGGALTNIAGAGGPDAGLMFSDQSAPLNLTLDLTNEGGGIVNFTNARMFMTFTLPAAQAPIPNLYIANVTGTFSIYDYTGNTRVDILTGTLTGGQFIKSGSSHTIVMNDGSGLTYTPGPRLSALLPAGSSLVPAHDGTFSLTNVRTLAGGTDIIGPNNTFSSFTATPAFSGSSTVVPTPGALVLCGIGGYLTARRRRS